MAWYGEFLQRNQVVLVPPKQKTQVWCPPSPNVLKLNVDGASVHSLHFGGVGGAIRNDKRKFITGFAYRKDFVASPQQVELMAIKDGIEFLQ